MAVCRVEKDKNYTTMSNYHLRDPNLSNKARGLLSTMLSLPENWDLKLPMDRIRKYFPRSYTPQKMEDTIIKLLEMWMKKRQRDQQR